MKENDFEKLKNCISLTSSPTSGLNEIAVEFAFTSGKFATASVSWFDDKSNTSKQEVFDNLDEANKFLLDLNDEFKK